VTSLEEAGLKKKNIMSRGNIVVRWRNRRINNRGMGMRALTY